MVSSETFRFVVGSVQANQYALHTLCTRLRVVAMNSPLVQEFAAVIVFRIQRDRCGCNLSEPLAKQEFAPK